MARAHRTPREEATNPDANVAAVDNLVGLLGDPTQRELAGRVRVMKWLYEHGDSLIYARSAQGLAGCELQVVQAMARLAVAGLRPAAVICAAGGGMTPRDQRLDLNWLIEECEASSLCCLAIRDLDRLGRRPDVPLFVLKDLRDLGVDLLLEDGPPMTVEELFERPDLVLPLQRWIED